MINTNKTRWITVLTFLIFGSFLNQSFCEDVTVTSYPSAPAENNMQTLSGSLTNAINTLTSPYGKHTGNSTRAQATAMPTTSEWRCLPPGVKAKVDDADVKITVSWPSSTIFTPAWINRTSLCSTATNEWNAFFNRVRNHELGHHTTTANYCVESIIVGGYFTGVDFGAESTWFGITQENDAKLNAQNQVITKCVTQANLIANYISGPLVSIYHSQVGSTTSAPSPAAECQ